MYKFVYKLMYYFIIKFVVEFIYVLIYILNNEYIHKGDMNMKIPNLKDIMISLNDFRKELSDIIANKKTKIIIKNNEPTSIIIPYDEYLALNNSVMINDGESIVLNNGVEVKVVVSVERSGSYEDLVTRTYIKMKSSGEWKEHFSHSMSAPSYEQTLTSQETMEYYQQNKK